MLSRRELANAIRALSMDAVEKAQSGHPGAPMGMADIMEVLWNDFLSHNPANPKWPNRDRFVLSNGHGSMLLYSLLHLTGYDLPLEEIINFRQLHSMTPGHPEYGYTPGVETTTGPLGQGLANAVGMAIAERTLAAQFNRGGLNIIDHFTYVSVGDGCLMEGISHEACSLAGTLGLGKLICIYDSNQISIDGDVSGWFTDNTAARMEAYGWHAIRGIDGHDAEQIKNALSEARSVTDKPSFICCHTVIGWGSPNKQGKESSHGAPLGEEEVKLAKQEIGWEHDAFVIPQEYYQAWDARENGREREQAWQELFNSYADKHPALAQEFHRRINKTLPENWEHQSRAFIHSTAGKAEDIATRKASQNALESYGPLLPELIGGSADLAGSNLTLWSGSKTNSIENPAGNYIYYGVREFGMCAINSGIALYGGFIPYAGTFLVFSDYARNAVRMSALMKQRSIFIFTHDSIGLGEDGPTHQAVEHSASLRLIPNMSVWRPCDTVETAIAWRVAIERLSGPTSLLLSRQKLSHIPRAEKQLKAIERGGYVLIEAGNEPELIILATGSEVEPAYRVATEFNESGRSVRLVSMPSSDVFDAQDKEYRDMVLPPRCRNRLAIEAGVSDYWHKYVGLDGRVLGIDQFGESAPGPVVYEHFGLTADGIRKLIGEML